MKLPPEFMPRIHQRFAIGLSAGVDYELSPGLVRSHRRHRPVVRNAKLTVSSHIPRLNDVCLKSLRQMQFLPATRGGKAVVGTPSYPSIGDFT
jgi:hypothetical protein